MWVFSPIRMAIRGSNHRGKYRLPCTETDKARGRKRDKGFTDHGHSRIVSPNRKTITRVYIACIRRASSMLCTSVSFHLAMYTVAPASACIRSKVMPMSNKLRAACTPREYRNTAECRMCLEYCDGGGELARYPRESSQNPRACKYPRRY